MTTNDYLEQLQQDREDLVDNLETKGITGLTGDETFTELVPEVLNIPSGEDLSTYFAKNIKSGTSSKAGYANMITYIPENTITAGTSLYYAFYGYQGETIPLLSTSSITSMESMFRSSRIESVPLLNTSNVTTMKNMFYSCTLLVTVPLFNTSSVTDLTNTFYDTRNLSNESLDNILQMCIGATSYNGTKTLAQLGLSSTYYPVSTIQALSHYQDFLNAGWTIGY